MVLVRARSTEPPVLIHKNKLTRYLLTLKNRRKPETQIQQSEPLQEQTLLVIPETLEIHEETFVEPQRSKEIQEDWVILIGEKLKQAHREHETKIWGKLCIYKVPYYLQEKDDKSYIPQTVSFGPYHHRKKQIRSMDCHKWRAVYMVLKRTEKDIKIYIDAMRRLEEKARACYEDPICLSSNEFIEMLLLDGCFILELFMGTAEGFTELGYDDNDPIFAMRGSMHSIRRDMVMLENQLPFFVLARLIELQFDKLDQTGLVTQLAVRFLDPLMPTDKLNVEEDEVVDHENLEISVGEDEFCNPYADMGELHCLHVFRRNLLLSSPKPERRKSASHVADKRRQQLIHSVTELREAGIKFKTRKTGRFWDIKFRNGYLEIPRLLIHDGTKSLFLNLIAFEQRHIDSNNDITSYLIFMDNLINSPEDVNYLHYCGIIEHWLGSDSEVADMFNRLCQEVVFDTKNSYLSRLSTDVNRYYNRKWNVWKATLRHKYFNNPWAYFSFIAAVILLFLTLFQSFFTIYAYFKPSS